MKKNNGNDIPKWLRYLLLCIAIGYILFVMLGKRGPQREDFPFFYR